MLSEVFSFEVTRSRAVCAGCGATNQVGALLVYRHGMGTIVRCPSCETAMLRLAGGDGRYRLDLRGMVFLEVAPA